MTANIFYNTPVADSAQWQRPEHLAAHLGVTVRTLRKWVARGRAERTRSYQGHVYYRLTGASGPVPAPRVGADDATKAHEERLEVLNQQVTAAQVEAAEFRTRVEAAMERDEQARQENSQLRRELEYQRELAALPWWARRRRRELTIPMDPLEVG